MNSPGPHNPLITVIGEDIQGRNGRASATGGVDSTLVRPRIEGKFLYLGPEKLFIRGVTYGAFPPNSHGDQFPEPHDVAKDLALMQEAGINAILTYTVPPPSLLDQAQAHGIRAIVTVPWMEYVCFLEERGPRKEIRRQIKEGIASCRRHPAVLMYCVGKEIPPSIVRWHGRRKVEEFLRELYQAAKDEDPDSLVTYTNFPTTEYLELPFVDVYTFNVYLHQRLDFCAYLSRLQHLAGELPLVLTEFGQCSYRHAREGQAAFLDWQLEEIFDHGLAGAVIFGWTDPFFQDGCLVDAWGFGLVDANRCPKPSYDVAKRRFTAGIPFPADRHLPKISVVVAAHNAARTLDDCLNSLRNLRYPDYEVIVVNDGSTDNSDAIIQRYPFRAITTPKGGVSAARNEGIRAATGEIVAYIDSDARADPEWLSYLVATFLESDVVGVGGPNLVPPEDKWVAKCVYRSPGGPTQVMLDDRSAEHIPGCNMAFWKWALEEIGGFDPIFQKAADDVDICWRLLERGHRIGFSPSAVVWHHRRSSVNAYWRQQVGYGESEALLERKHPNKFNPWGHTFWAGRIYAPYPFFRPFGRPVIYHGLWGSAGFQSMYDPGGGGILNFLPRAMESHFALVFLMFLGIFVPWVLALCALGLGYMAWYCWASAALAKIDDLVATDGPPTWARRLRWRAMIAWLHFLEPLARDWGRLKSGLTPWRSALQGARPRPCASRWWQRVRPLRRRVHWSYPGDPACEKFTFLDRLTRNLVARGCAVGWNADWQDWDLKVRRGVLGEAQLRMVVEHHGGPRRLARLSTVIRSAKPLTWFQGALAASAMGLGFLGHYLPLVVLAVVLGLLWVACLVEADRLEVAVRSAADEVADRLLSPETRRG
ncbi:MAG TPA: glycosyltransferase [Candidatus Methylomirabilis sp.]|nr:glycosyltransferase [Candidatus Methylomirabilis sp.]HSC70433.1 glycosyltransferase [Candidatus Methylomirabilis sp.]